MKRLTALAFLAVSLLRAADQTFNGVVTDSMCGAGHAAMKVTPDAKCTTECVKAGAKYALYDGKKTYTLSDQTASAKFAGQKVKVTGTLDEKAVTIKVAKIEASR